MHQFCVKLVHHTFLCLEVTGSSEHLVLRLSEVSSFDFPFGVRQRCIFLKWSWWHPGAIICVLHLDWCSGPADDELGSNGRPADSFSTSLRIPPDDEPGSTVVLQVELLGFPQISWE